MSTTERTSLIPDGSATLAAWQRLLRAQCVLIRVLDAEMRTAHGMTLSDYDVLVNLRDAGDDRLKMSDLSRRTLLTRSGMTRLVQGLENNGLVARGACPSDQRVSYVHITDTGLEALAQARATHHAGIRRVFAEHFSDAEMHQLAELIGRIPGVTDDACCDAAPACPED